MLNDITIISDNMTEYYNMFLEATNNGTTGVISAADIFDIYVSCVDDSCMYAIEA